MRATPTAVSVGGGLVALALLARAAGAAAPAPRVAPPAVDSALYAVRIDGVLVGRAREIVERDAHTVRSRSTTSLRVSRAGRVLRMTIASAETTDAVEGLLAAGASVAAGATAMRVWVRRVGDTLVVHETTAGVTRRRRVVWPPGALASTLAEDRMAAWLARGGADSLSLEVLDVLEARVQRVVWRRRGIDTLDVAGRRVPTTIVSRTVDGARAAASVEHWDAEGRLWRSRTRQMGLAVELERMAPGEAGRLGPAGELDVVRRTRIECDGCDAIPARWHRVRLRVPLAPGVGAPGGLDGAGQRRVGAGEGYAVVECTRGASAAAPRSGPDAHRRWLRPDRDVQCDAPRIRAVADSLRRGRDARRFVEAAVWWVDRAIVRKGYGEGFASALDVLRTRAGDCTEHSVLLAALLRAGGVPARPVAGLVWTGSGFGGHMWVEAVLEGRWRALDALDPGLAHPHLRLAEVPPGRGLTALADAFARVGSGPVRVLEVSPR